MVGGIWGVLFEQNYKGLEMLQAAFPKGSVLPEWEPLWAFINFGGFIFGVYGFYLAGPYLLFYEEFSAKKRIHRPWKSISLFFLVWWGVIGFMWLWGKIQGLFS